MAKTVISAFDNPQGAAKFMDSAVSCGFDSHLFSVINPQAGAIAPLESVMRDVPSIPARHYKDALRQGESLLVARIPENEVRRLIELLQAAGGSYIEAFDYISNASQAAH